MDLPDTRGSSPETLKHLRIIAVHAVFELKMTRKAVAEILGVGENAVGQWCVAYEKDGMKGLEVETPGRPLGVGRVLSPAEEQALQEAIRETVPEDHQLSFATWTRRAVRDLIHKWYDVELTLQAVGNYLHRWKMTPQKPARHAREQDPEEVREFLEETLPDVIEKAEEEGGQLCFADETGTQVGDQIQTSYAPEGETPVLEIPKTRIRQNLILSVTPDGDVFPWLFPGTLNSSKFLDDLEELVDSSSEKLFLFLDSHPAHTAQKVEDWVSVRQDQIEITWLPGYSPEFNPTEFLNNDLKQNLKNQPMPENGDDFRESIRQILDTIKCWPERVKGYFRQSKIELACE